MKHTNFDHVYTCFDLDPGDMKLDRGNDIYYKIMDDSCVKYPKGSIMELIVQNLFEQSDRYIEPPF